MAIHPFSSPVCSLSWLLSAGALTILLVSCNGNKDPAPSTVDSGPDSPSPSAPADDPADNPFATVINPDNAAALLAFVIETANGAPVDTLTGTLNKLYPAGIFGEDSVDATLGLIPVVNPPAPEISGMPPVVYQCDLGGSYTFIDSGSATGGGGGSFDSCTLSGLNGGGSTLDGSFGRTLEIIKYVYNPGFSTSTEFSNYSVTGGEGSGTLSGYFYESTGPKSFYRLSEVSLATTSGADETLVNYSTVTLSDGVEDDGSQESSPWQRTFSANLQVSAPVSNQEILTVDTTLPFVTSAAGLCYESGLLTVSAQDGSYLIMRADNGDPDSFQLDIGSGVSTTSLTLGWSDRFELRQLETGQAKAPVVSDGQPGSACSISDRETDLLH